MKRIALTILPLAALALIPADAAAPDAPTAERRPSAFATGAFKALSEQFINAATRTSPVEATALGEHRFDGLLPNITPAGRASRVAMWRQLLGYLVSLNPDDLSRADQVDYALLKNELQYRIWQSDVSQDWAWNTQTYNDIAASSLYTLAARDFAPWDVRLKAATARMEALPAFLLESRKQLDPKRVPLIFAQTVAKQNGGIIEIAEGMLAPHADALNGADRTRFDAALAALKVAVAGQQRWLDTVLLPQAKGDFRLGPARYDQKMKFALMSDITRPQLKALALKAKSEIRAEMYRLAQEMFLSGWLGKSTLPDNPTPEQQQAGIEAALQLTYAKRPPRAELEQRARDTLAQASDFVRQQGFVRMPDGPVQVITMPKFQQGNSTAYNDPPGPFEKDQQNFYAVSPVPADWSNEQAASYLTEYNDYMIQDLSIHEAMPGHYLQLDHANRSPDLLRAYLGSGPFIEGWAVYAEGMMADQGYLNGDPLFKLTVLKMRLRSVTNTLLDIGIQTEGMSRDAAMDLMMKGAFQTEREAAGKWVRASLSSVQRLSYFTGYSEHMALREEAKQRWGKDYSLRRYNDTVLSFGSPPVKYARALMFGLPVK
ncbi:MAG: DUF885 domain-containing protein [Novosphingobium sp.]|uniref:DUF885 domain-containing protein n=1 Tax=Novosphingobium sp. TaxID=1874826 RepID=UPI003C7C7354